MIDITDLHEYQPRPRSNSLPSREFCQIDLGNPEEYYHSLDTPVDERGLIDIPQLIQVVKTCVNPNYTWPQELSVHHFYHPGSWYPYQPQDGEASNPHVFRNLPIHKGLMPRQFENLLHWVTREPPMPDKDVMRYRVEAWTVAKNLFRMARHTVQWEKRARRRRELIAAQPAIIKAEFNGQDIIGEEIIEEVLSRHFRGIEHQIKRHENIPTEFRLVAFDGSAEVLATSLGKLIVPSSLSLVKAVAA